MKPVNIKGQRLKEVRQIHRRIDEIWKEKQKLKLIKLEKPIRHGWFKELIITENSKRYKNQKYIQEVYYMVEKKVWAKTKEEADHKWLHQTSKYLINKDIPTINKKQFNKLSKEAMRLCTPFQYYTEKKRLRTRYYINIPRGAYKIKFTRAYVTHTRQVDSILESENSLLFQKLLRAGYFEAEKKLHPWKSHWDWPNYREKTKQIKVKVRALKQFAVDEIIKEELSWERN